MKTLTDVGTDEPIGPPPRPTLRLLHTGERLAVHAARLLRAGALATGREVDRESLNLPEDRRASRHHATFHVAAGSVRLVDNDSKNGTFVNGRRVRESALADGDVVRIGDSFLLLRFAPAEARDADLPSLVGVSPASVALRRALLELATARATVLLLGESGTGKEVAAQALHDASGRSGPLVTVNCSAIPESLAESQLFGHVAGAFTGAKATPGLFRAADRGTLFLDEIGDLSLALQPKLLRAVEQSEVTPVGSVTPIRVDIRIIAATHRDLARAVEEQTFRGDLHARLAEAPLRLPPLRARREDILPLLIAALGPPACRVTPRLVEALLVHRWPFNVRELFKVAAELRRSAGRTDALLDLEPVADRLTTEVREATATATGPAPGPASSEREPAPDRDALVLLLEKHHGNVSRIAREVGRSRRQVDRWLTELALDPHAFRER